MLFQTKWDNECIIPVLNALDQYQTPWYCFNTDIFAENIDILRNMLPKQAKICYSLKANPWLLNTAVEITDYVEVCSPGEVSICQSANVNFSKLVIGGVNKTYDDLYEVASYQPHRISIESIQQLIHLERAAEKLQLTANILLRLSSGNQFGMPEEDINVILNSMEKYPHIRINGVHFYSGTAKKTPKEITKDFDVINRFLDQCPYPLKEIEYGPGIGFPLFTNQTPDNYKECIEELSRQISVIVDKYIIILEFGRLVTANTGVYISTIKEIKSGNNKTFVIIDGGIHQLSYFGQINGCPSPYLLQPYYEKGESANVVICGSLCTANDILIKNPQIRQPILNTPLIFFNVGAYSMTEARSLFLSRALPKVLLQKNGEIALCRNTINTYELNTYERKNANEH